MLSHPAVVAVNAALCVLWIVGVLAASDDGGRAAASFLAGMHGSLAFVGYHRRR